MKTKIALISTGVGVVPAISSMVKEFNSDLDIINFVDDSVIRAIASNNNLIPSSVFRRLSSYFINAEEVGAVGAILTCSSVNEVVDVASKLVSIPCFKIDQPMVDKALQIGKKIAVAATLQTTLSPTKRLINSRAKHLNKAIEMTECLCEGAYDAWQQGNQEKHNRIVGLAIENLALSNDVVVLAQASMANAIEAIPEHLKDKVLTSPRLGIYSALKTLGLIDS